MYKGICLYQPSDVKKEHGQIDTIVEATLPETTAAIAAAGTQEATILETTLENNCKKRGLVFRGKTSANDDENWTIFHAVSDQLLVLAVEELLQKIKDVLEENPSIQVSIIFMFIGVP